MNITLGAIRKIIDDYNKQNNRNFKVANEIVHQIKDHFEDTKYYKGTPEELVVDLYKELKKGD